MYRFFYLVCLTKVLSQLLLANITRIRTSSGMKDTNLCRAKATMGAISFFYYH